MTDGHPITARSDPRIMPDTAVPKIYVSAELLALIERWPNDDARLERQANGDMIGSILRMRLNGTYMVYRITGESPFGNAYKAEWV